MNPQSNLISKDKLRDVLVSRTAAQLETDQSLVDKVITFIFKDAGKAFKTSNSVELSGFGVFKYSLRKLKKDLERKEVIVADLKLIQDPSKKEKELLEYFTKYIEDVKTKINELEKS